MAADSFGRKVLIIFWSVMVLGGTVSLGTNLPLCPRDCICNGTSINCSRRNLKEFPKAIPSNARLIDLSYNKISQIDIKELSRFTRLKSLKLHHNDLKSLPPWSKFPVTLGQLSLQHNKITVLPTQPFNSTGQQGINLRKLFLSHNSISRIEEGAFFGINPERLQVLKLNRNQLDSFPANAIKGLKKLKLLDLTRNKIHTLTTFFLLNTDISSLKTLRLSKNRISTIGYSAFVNQDKLETIYLDNNNLSSINADQFYGLHNSLQQLFLNDNQITEIIGNSKWSACCSVLSKLDLARNNLKHITSSTFKELLHVKSLNLSGNRISNIAKDAFSQMKLLRNLDLSNNHITWSSWEGNNGIFAGLEDLETLRLDHNRITTITRDAFAGLNKVVNLNLSANIISSVQENAFGHMESLTRLYLDTKNLYCDCKLKWLPPWITTRRIRANVKGVCLRPENLHGRSMFNVSSKDFVCDTGHPAPKIISNPKSPQKVVEGSNVTFKCIVSVLAKNDSKLTLEWKRDSITLRSIVINTGLAESPYGMKYFPNQLQLTRVKRKDDEGFYQCIARNAFGDHSKKFQLKVLVGPKLQKVPEELTVHAGKPATFSCSATGNPKPEIRWRKDGGEKFPAAQERRLRHVPPDDYIINDAKPEDMGEYSCFAKNEVGTVNASASLTVLDVPQIKEEMKSRTAKIGNSVVFQCEASGSPAPTFLWLKDGKKINKTARFLSTASGQLCVIVRVEKKHAGKYTCRVSNTLGHAERSAYLKVEGESEQTKDNSNGNLIQHDKKTFLGIIVIVVVACVIGTSIVWLIVIFCARKSEKASRPDAKLAVEARDDISYLPLKSSSSGSTQASRDSPRSTATFLTSAESQVTSAFPRSTSGSEVASTCDKVSSGDNLFAEISPKGSHGSLNSSSPSDSITHIDQRMVVKAQVHSSSDSDSEKLVCRTSSPCRKKNTKGAKSIEETIPLKERHTNTYEDKPRCKIATLDGIYEEREGMFRPCNNYGVNESNSSRLNSTDSNSSV